MSTNKSSFPGEPHYTTVVEGGKHWSLRLRRGLSLQLTNTSGSANVGMVMYNAHNLLERYNAPDTLKCQHTFHLTQGHCLYSDMGHVMASIVSDTAGGHESICGNSTAASVASQYGARHYQSDRNYWHQNGYDAFLVELTKYGLGRADLPANVNWFSKCSIGDEGQLELDSNDAEEGSSVTLRIDMDCVVVLHTCPHPLAIDNNYNAAAVSVAIADAPPMTSDDLCLNSCDENRRGFENNRLYHLGIA